MEQVVQNWPKSDEDAESLWHIAFSYSALYDGGKEGYRLGLPYLERYYKEYPKAPRWINAPKWIGRFKERMQ